MQIHANTEFSSHKNGPLFDYFMNHSVSVKLKKNLYIVVKIVIMLGVFFTTGV